MAGEEQLAELLLKIPRGEATLAAALGLHPTILDKLADKAMGLVDHGKLDEAEKLLLDLSRVDSVSPVLPFLLGACRARNQDQLGAIDAYADGLERAERVGFAAMIPRVRICRARALVELGRFEEARIDLAEVARGTDPALAQEAKAALERMTV